MRKFVVSHVGGIKESKSIGKERRVRLTIKNEEKGGSIHPSVIGDAPKKRSTQKRAAPIVF